MDTEEVVENIVEIENLMVSYDDRVVLDGVNFQVRRGETMVILGGSGCGKSTLLRHIIGLERPTSGRIMIKGRDLTVMGEEEMSGILSKVGVVFQSSALFNSMTIGDNVALPLREHTKLEESTIKIMTKIKLEMVGLSGFESYLPSELSGGMRKRAAFARAISMDPEILFCDEPSAGLDPIVGAGLDQLIIKLSKALRMTIVVVTHEMESMYTIADRVLMLHNGRVMFCGTVEEFRACDNERVRQFIERRPEEHHEEESGQYVRALTSDSF
ncbi:MAG: ABC transporter ATP-binding protein [Candidatus Glassbacteria bacterium]|nr:ABC transporter ATP-binding protein [Candidatus Glassbacteria bacterium]